MDQKHTGLKTKAKKLDTEKYSNLKNQLMYHRMVGACMSQNRYPVISLVKKSKPFTILVMLYLFIVALDRSGKYSIKLNEEGDRARRGL